MNRCSRWVSQSLNPTYVRPFALIQQHWPSNPGFIDTAAWIAYRRGNLDLAWSYIQDALMTAPENGVHNLHAAMILHELGDPSQAVVYLTRALRQEMDAKSRQTALSLEEKWKVLD